MSHSSYFTLRRWSSAWIIEQHEGTEHPLDGFATCADAFSHVRELGGGSVRLFCDANDLTCSQTADVYRLRRDRELTQMRVQLPLADSVRRSSDSIHLRTFRPGIDDQAWLAVNNAAFAEHPEQGNWDTQMLAQQLAEPWFSATDFLLCEEAGRLIGFCWTKVHTETHPPMGEIFVIGVDPAHHGKGMGRRLVVAGLNHLSTRNVGTGMLYVERHNFTAFALYEELGFVEHHRIHCFSGMLNGLGSSVNSRSTKRPS
jgi:mycothiol synthase